MPTLCWQAEAPFWWPHCGAGRSQPRDPFSDPAIIDVSSKPDPKAPTGREINSSGVKTTYKMPLSPLTEERAFPCCVLLGGVLGWPSDLSSDPNLRSSAETMFIFFLILVLNNLHFSSQSSGKVQIQFGLSTGQRFSKTASKTAVFLRRQNHVQKKNKVE